MKNRLLTLPLLALFVLAVSAGGASAADKNWQATGPLVVYPQVHNGLITYAEGQSNVTILNPQPFTVGGKLTFYAAKGKKAVGRPLAIGYFTNSADQPTTAIVTPTKIGEKKIKFSKKKKALPIVVKIWSHDGGNNQISNASANYTLVPRQKGAKGAANTAPVAQDKSYTVAEGATLNLKPAGLLDGSTDADGDHLSLKLVAPPAKFKTFNLGADGLLSFVGAANFSGKVTFTYQAFDGAAYSNTATVTITVTPKKPAIAAIADQLVNGGDQASAQTIATKGFVTSSATVTYALTGTPPTGATINTSTGVITIPSGAVTAGTYNVTLSATNSAGSATKAFKIIVKPGKLGTISDQEVLEDDPISPLSTASYFTASAGATYSATGLPTGLSIDPSTGVISGTPTTPGVNNVTVTITDANGTANQAFTWTIDADV